MATLQGAAELKARLKRVRLVFKPMGRAWADGAVEAGRPIVPVKTGRLRRSIRRKSATQRKATVVAHYTAYFVDHGTKAHEIRPKKAKQMVFTDGGRTVFSKQVNHPRTKAQPFRARMAMESLRRHPLGDTLIRIWNGGSVE
jgi:hypothetical protein